VFPHVSAILSWAVANQWSSTGPRAGKAWSRRSGPVTDASAPWRSSACPHSGNAVRVGRDRGHQVIDPLASCCRHRVGEGLPSSRPGVRWIAIGTSPPIDSSDAGALIGVPGIGALTHAGGPGDACRNGRRACASRRHALNVQRSLVRVSSPGLLVWRGRNGPNSQGDAFGLPPFARQWLPDRSREQVIRAVSWALTPGLEVQAIRRR